MDLVIVDEGHQVINPGRLEPLSSSGRDRVFDCYASCNRQDPVAEVGVLQGRSPDWHEWIHLSRRQGEIGALSGLPVGEVGKDCPES